MAGPYERRRLHVCRDITEFDQREHELRLRRESIDQTISDEQRRLGEQIHGPIQLLTAALMRVGSARASEEPSELESAEAMISSAVGELRTVSSELVPQPTGQLAATLYLVGREALVRGRCSESVPRRGTRAESRDHRR